MKNIAVIGYGGQGAWHCSQILASDVCNLTGTYDIRHVRNDAAKANGIFVYDSNEAIFADNTVDIGDFFDNNSVQGTLELGKYCSNIIYSDNNFIDSGFLRHKEIVKSDSIYVWAQINSQL